MKTLATYLIGYLLAISSVAQQKAFHRKDTRLKVYYGDTVSILTDSAYIVSSAQALLLNEKLIALQEAQRTNQSLYHAHEGLLHKVSEIEEEVARLLTRLRTDQKVMEQNMVLLLSELDQSIAILQQSNVALTQTNDQLAAQLSQLDQTVMHLRNENRRLAWRHTRDKVVIGLAAFVLGLVVGG
ncbi:MAG: hypothetical protein RIC35_14940 [Marinoscillum sp.]